MNRELRPLALPLIFLVAFNVLPSFWFRPTWFTALAVIILAYRLWLELSWRNMPPRWTQWVVQVAVGVAVWQHYRSLFGDEAAGTWLTLLTILKLFELRGKRDYFITALLCFLVLMSLLLLDQSLLLSFFLLADVALIVGFLYALEEERWQWSQWSHYVRRPLGLLVRVVPLLVLIFLLFPRFSTGFGTGKQGSAKTGITDQLRPGSISDLAPSDEVVFRATFLNGDVPPRQALYWRGAVLERSRGLNWDRAEADLKRAPFPRGTQNEIEIYLEPGSEKFLFTLENTLALDMPTDINRNRIGVREGGIFELSEALQTRQRYFLESTDKDPAPTRDLERYLKVGEPPSKELEKFLNGLRGLSTAETVRRLHENYSKNGYGYSLQPPKVTTVDDFFFKTKTGFCEHFAGAMATLLRHLKIPSRVVVGFQGGSSSFLDNYITVRAHDAHAWLEYYDSDAQRWRRSDPTASVAPSRFVTGSDGFTGRNWVPNWVPNRWETTYLKARAMIDEVEANWVGFLLRFDLAKQKELLAKLGMEAVLFRALPVFLVLAVALVLAVLYFVEAQGREPLSTEELLYRKFLRVLKRRNFAKAANEGPLTLMGRIEKDDPDLALRCQPIVDELLVARFGSKNLSRRAAAEISRQIRALTRA